MQPFGDVVEALLAAMLYSGDGAFSAVLDAAVAMRLEFVNLGMLRKMTDEARIRLPSSGSSSSSTA